jgi:hypothetical protein
VDRLCGRGYRRLHDFQGYLLKPFRVHRSLFMTLAEAGMLLPPFMLVPHDLPAMQLKGDTSAAKESSSTHNMQYSGNSSAFLIDKIDERDIMITNRYGGLLVA